MKKWMLWCFLCLVAQPGYAWNLWQDVEENTQWTLGQIAAAGTSVNLRNGQYCPSEFAQIANYRMFSTWYGGIEIPQGDGTLKLTDSAKMGLNLGYFLRGFTNKPPMLIQNLVVGPAISTSLATTPRVVNYWVDINFQFGSNASPVSQSNTTATVASTPEPPAIVNATPGPRPIFSR